MNIHELTVDKVKDLPEPLVREVSDFIDFLLIKQDDVRWQQFRESLKLAETDSLETYESLLANGEIQWQS
ncbi:MAG: DUF2281 domain-containing protein [Desulfobacteraceae bacterium]|nr:DUF2281 domain-containing protein [Desulfobacteraceae bacterium]